MSGSTLLNALTNPGVDALLGAAQGFAQAAMPSRLPVPIGAAFGMGGAGALQGLRSGQQLQQAQEAIQQARLNNQMLGMYVHALPGAVGLATGSPGSAAAPAAGASPTAPSGGSPAGAPGATLPSGLPFLVAPQEDVALRNLALMRGDVSAAATLNGQLQAMGGGPGYSMTPAGTAFAVPGGAKDPRVIGQSAGAEAQGKLPAELAAKGWMIGPGGQLQPVPGGMADPAYIGAAGAAKPFTMRPGGMHWDALHGTIKNPELERVTNPDGSKGYAWMTPPEPSWSSPGGGTPQQGGNAPPPDPFPGWAQRIDQAENGTGNPAATNPNSTAAGNGQFTDPTWPSVIRAVRPDLTAGMSDQQIMALRDIPGVAQEATTAYARQNAATLAQNGLPITAGTVYLSHVLGPQGAARVLQANPNTPLSMLLSKQAIAGNPQFQGKATAGDAVIWAQNAMHVAPPPNATPSQPPVASQNAPAPPNTADGRAAPVLDQSGKPAMADLSPGAEDALKDYTTKDADAYEAAQNTKAWVSQILHAANTMTSAGPAYWTGPYAPERLAAMSNLNDLARSVGLKAPFDQNAIASWEEMKKATVTAGFELSSHYEGHARQAAATIENATSAVPAEKNSPIGLQLVSHGILEGAQAATDLHDYKTQMYREDGAQGLVGAEDDFYRKFPPTMYAQRAISTVHPVEITNPQQFNGYLPGTYAILPVPKGSPGYDAHWNGKLVQVPMRPGAPPIPSYLQPQAAAPAPPAPAPAEPPVPMPPPGSG